MLTPVGTGAGHEGVGTGDGTWIMRPVWGIGAGKGTDTLLQPERAHSNRAATKRRFTQGLYHTRRQEMDEQEIRKVIAEFMGYTVLSFRPDIGYMDGTLLGKGYSHVPDYLNDLNAMHLVEAELERRGLDEKYAWRLGDVLRAAMLDGHLGLELVGINTAFRFAHATAAQCARAAYEVITQHKAQEQQQQKEG